MPFCQKGETPIRCEEARSGFSLLITPAGSEFADQRLADSGVNAMEALKSDFHCITMDQRIANGGESIGPSAGR